MNPIATLSTKEWGTAIVVAILAITAAVVGSYFKTSAQRQATDPRADRAYERLIEKRTNSAIRNEPVEITLAKTRKGAVEFNRAFKDQDNDWLKGFTLTAKNISQRPITFIDVTYSFERPKDQDNSNQPALINTLTFGSIGKNANQAKLNPGESTELVLDDATHDFLQQALGKAGYTTSVQRIRFYLSQVIFADGTMWSLGYWYQRDPANAENWIRIPEVGKKVGPGKNGAGKDRVAMRSHTRAAAPRATTPSLSSYDNPCMDPGFPAWIKCPGAASDLCMRKVQPTLFSQITHTHRDKAVVMPCKQCVQNGSNLDCDSVPHCTDVVLAPSTTPELCPPNGSCNMPPDFTTYPSTGCVSGLVVIDGVCQRSLAFQQRCAGPTYYDPPTCSCPDGVEPSPIIIDVDHSGFTMTSAADGVLFNILNDGVPLKLSWTSGSSSNAFLAIDLNGNGAIDNGTELFGDLSPQPSSPTPNGFSALAQYDKRSAGGNDNGIIDPGDSVFGRLILWRDANHNGASEANELRGLSWYGIDTLEFKCHESRWIDQFGNQFRYRAKVNYARGLRSGRWAWDVFLKVD